MNRLPKWVPLVVAVVVPGGLLLAGLWWWREREAMRTLPAHEVARLASLTPRFRRPVALLLMALRSADIPYFLGDGKRDTGRQRELYNAFLAGGPRASPPGESAHEFGEGLDVNVYELGGAVPPSITHSLWQRFGAMARAQGLTWGGDFKSGQPDGPHVEHPKWRELRDAARGNVA